MSSGKKYLRAVANIHGQTLEDVDIYSLLDAWQVKCPAVQHALKKLIMPGQRKKGDALQDLTEAADAVARAITLERARQERHRKETSGQVKGY